MSNDNERKEERETILKRAYSPIGLPEQIERAYSPIGLTFDSTDMGEPSEKPTVHSVKVLTARPGDPIPECEGYELQDYIPNATLVVSPGDIPIALGEFTDVYVFVMRYAAELE